MSGDAHVRICESLGVKFPRATRLVIVIRRKRYWLWRAVDNEGEVLDFLVLRRRPAKAAKRLMKKLLKTQGFAPSRVVADKLRSYPSAFRAIGLAAEHDRGLRANDRARDFASTGSPARYPNYKGSPHPAPRNVSSPSISATYNTFYHRRHLLKRAMFKELRSASFEVWQGASVAARPGHRVAQISSRYGLCDNADE